MWATLSRTTSILINSKVTVRCYYCCAGGSKNSLIFGLSRQISDIVRILTDYRMTTVDNLVKNTKLADSLIAEISDKIQKMTPNTGTEIETLRKTNEELRKEVQKWKEMLTVAEILDGQEPAYYLHYIIPPNAEGDSQVLANKASTDKSTDQSKTSSTSNNPKEAKTDENLNATETQPASEDTGSKPAKQAKKAQPKSGGNASPASPAATEVVDVSRLDFRIGKIVEVDRHPEADSLYLEKIDVGEEKPRTVISGLVKHVPLENMRDRLVVLLCNLKPAKMRGITSEAMVMCASTPDKVEILVPPAGVVPGDLVEFEGYPRNPDSVLNPKKKIFETVAPDLKTDANKVATYKGIPFMVKGKGNVVAETLAGVNIK